MAALQKVTGLRSLGRRSTTETGVLFQVYDHGTGRRASQVKEVSDSSTANEDRFFITRSTSRRRMGHLHSPLSRALSASFPTFEHCNRGCDVNEITELTLSLAHAFAFALSAVFRAFSTRAQLSPQPKLRISLDLWNCFT